MSGGAWLVLILFVVVAFIAAAEAESKKKRREAAFKAGPRSARMDVPGSAKFVTEPKELKRAGLLGGKGIRIGHSPKGSKAKGGKPLRYDGDAMLITVAPVGSGKGTSAIIPNALCLDDRSLLIFDPKGENVACTGHYRKRLGPVYVLNPYRILLEYMKGLKQARFNPMGRLLDPKEGPLRFGPIAEKLAEGIVWRETEGSEAEHFSASARQLIHGLIMAVARHEPAEKKNLVRVAEIVSTGEAWEFCGAVMKKTSDPFIRQKLGRFAAPGAWENKELNSIVSTAVTQVGFLGDAAIADCISGNDFRFHDLREKTCTVYVVLPLDFLEVAGKFFRLIVSSALGDLLQPGRGKRRVLIIMDEFFQYGALSAVENAVGMARGFGVQLWPILQDLSQLEGRYPRTWQTFLSNAGVRMFMTPQDDKTASYISGQCGFTQLVESTPSVSVNDNHRDGFSQTWGKHITRQELFLPHQAREMDAREMLLFVRGVAGPIKAQRRGYFEDGDCRGKYRANPYFKPRGVLSKIFG